MVGHSCVVVIVYLVVVGLTNVIFFLFRIRLSLASITMTTQSNLQSCNFQAYRDRLNVILESASHILLFEGDSHMIVWILPGSIYLDEKACIFFWFLTKFLLDHFFPWIILFLINTSFDREISLICLFFLIHKIMIEELSSSLFPLNLFDPLRCTFFNNSMTPKPYKVKKVL